MPKITISKNHNFTVPSDKKILSWIEFSLLYMNSPGSFFNIQIVNENEMLKLCNQFKNKNEPTNILSFSLDNQIELPYEYANFIGDLAICPPIIKEEANIQEKKIEHHWCHILIHGILHLLGYDHIDKQDSIIMETIEVLVLNELGINNPYR